MSDSMASISDTVARIALTAAAAHAQSNSAVTIDSVRFNLVEKGMCAKFVRQCHEAALGIADHTWAYAAANALQMEMRLKNTRVLGDDEPQPGDIVAINRSSGANGHIGIVVGGGYFCENTSSTSRGPGTVKSRLSLVASRITGYYRPYPSVDQGETKVEPLICVVLPGYEHTVPIELRDGASWGPLREFGEALHAQGLAVELEWNHDHLDDQRKVYVAAAE